MDISDQTEELDPIEIAEELTVEEYFDYIGLLEKLMKMPWNMTILNYHFKKE